MFYIITIIFVVMFYMNKYNIMSSKCWLVFESSWPESSGGLASETVRNIGIAISVNKAVNHK